PIWLNFASPHSLELLRQLSAEDGRIASMTEALPAVGQHWVPAPGGDPGARTCEFISLVRWPMLETSDVRSAGEIHQERIADEDGWLYYKICPGKFDRWDDVVRRIVAPGTDAVRRSSSLRRWFFTRYIDRNGPHIRLRIRVPATHTEAVHSLLASLFDRELPALQSRDLLPFVPNADDGFRMREWTPDWMAADYEPEYDKYGGSAGVAIAERLFEASSELAVRVALSTLSGESLRIARTRCCLRTMSDLVQAFHMEHER